MPHKIVKTVVSGSVGDLGRIAGALAGASPPFDLAAVGGGEGFVGDGEVGIITFVIRDDEGREDEIVEIISNVDLGDHELLGVELHPAMLVELKDEPGSLARAAEVIGDTEHNIMGVLLVDNHFGLAHVGFGFETDFARDEAKAALEADGFVIVPHEDHDHHDDRSGPG